MVIKSGSKNVCFTLFVKWGNLPVSGITEEVVGDFFKNLGRETWVWTAWVLACCKWFL